MEKAWYRFLRFLTLVTVAVWFLTVAHALIGHSDTASCDHSASETACSCVCHTAFEPADEAPVLIEQPITVFIPSPDEKICGLLLPDDIFRPPLTNG